MKRYEFWIAKRHLRSGRRVRFASLNTYIAICGVAIGVAALAIVLSVMNGFASAVWAGLLGMDAHVDIRKFHARSMSEYTPILHYLQKQQRVVAVSPYIEYEGLILNRQEGESGVVIRGMDAASIAKITDMKKHMWAGDLTFYVSDDGKGAGIIVGKLLADKLGLFIGSETFLVTPRRDMGSLLSMPRYDRFTVMGIFATGFYEFDSGLVMISIGSAQNALGWKDEISGIKVKVDDPFTADRVTQGLNRMLEYPIYAVSWIETKGNLYTFINLEKLFGFLALSLIVVVACFNIVSILNMMVTEKRREIGILKAMGMPSMTILRIFLIEGLVIGAAGVILGDILGFVLCWAQDTFRFISLPGDVYIIDSLPVEMRILDFILISIASLVICLLAASYPSRRAASLIPIEAIRYE